MKTTLLLALFIALNVSTQAIPARIDLAAEDSFYSGPSVLSDDVFNWKLVTTNNADITVSGLDAKMKLGGWKIGSVGPHTISIYDDYRYSSEDTAYIQFEELEQNSVYDIVIYAGTLNNDQYKSSETYLICGTHGDETHKKTAPSQFYEFEENNNYIRFKAVQCDVHGIIRFEFDGKKCQQILNAVEIEKIDEPSAILLTLK